MRSTDSKRQRGFGLVEVMVAMVIGMLTVLAVLQTLAAAEGQRRNITSGADAGVSGSMALQIMQREIFNAGYGLTLDADLFALCAGQRILAYNADRSPPDLEIEPSAFAPVLINPPGYPAPDPDTDVLQITYSGSMSSIGRGVSVTSPSAASSVYTVTAGSRAAFHAGDLAIAVEAGKDCVVSQVTQLPNGAGNPDECGQNGGGTDRNIIHNNGNFRDSYRGCQTVDARWNKPGGLGVHIADGKLFSLGPPDQLVVRAYAVRGGRLTVCSPLLVDCTAPANWEVAAEGIVALRAQYGYDADDDGVEATEWIRDLGVVAPVTWSRLKAVRLALVARGSHYERELVWADCTPDWAGLARDNLDCTAAPAAGELVLRSAPDGVNWAHYRYKVFQTTAQARNLFWSDNL